MLTCTLKGPSLSPLAKPIALTHPTWWGQGRGKTGEVKAKIRKSKLQERSLSTGKRGGEGLKKMTSKISPGSRSAFDLFYI